LSGCAAAGTVPVPEPEPEPACTLAPPPEDVPYPSAEACPGYELCFTFEQAKAQERWENAWREYGRRAWAGCGAVD
jgi:hypothetical protein